MTDPSPLSDRPRGSAARSENQAAFARLRADLRGRIVGQDALIERL